MKLGKLIYIPKKNKHNELPDFAMFEAIISEPASPNPSANKVPIFMMAFSITTVSYSSFPSADYVISISFDSIGFRAILFTNRIIFSIGYSANVVASEVNMTAPKVNTIQIKIVRPILNPADIVYSLRLFKKAAN